MGQIINGLAIGCVYALIAAGMTLIFGVLDRLNLAHTEVFAAGGFAAAVTASSGLSVWWGLPLSFMAGGVIGLLVERISFRKFVSADARITAALSSLGIGMVLIDLIRKVWGSDPAAVDLTGPMFMGGVEFAGVRFNWFVVLLMAVSLLLCLVLHLMITNTGLGRRVRAVAESAERAALIGVDVVAVARLMFFLSSALAAVAGFFVALRAGSANPDIGLGFGLKAVAIMAIGGMGELRGALLAGLLVGVLEALMFQANLGRLSEMLVWVLMIAVLLVRPDGLFGSGAHGRQERV